MLGAIIGDIVGSRFEFNNHRDKEFDLFTEDCFVTDDSIMTLCLAKAIMDARNYDWNQTYYGFLRELAIKYMKEIGRRYPDCGYGEKFREWVFLYDPEPYNSFGNGAAMRVSPAGFAGRSEEEVKQLTYCVTAVTHNHPEGLKGAEATAIAIYMARMNCTKTEIRERITHDYYPLDFTINDIRETYQFNETCQETVPQAIEAFLESSSFEDAIRTAISVGGDSDTLAAITGGIAEAYYGVPNELREKALAYLDGDLRAIYDAWTKRFICNPSRFNVITKYIEKLSGEKSFGEWTTVTKHNENLQLPFVRFSRVVNEFLQEYSAFTSCHFEFGPPFLNYREILEQNKIEWSAESLRDAKVATLDAPCVLALITGVIRADRFSEGILLNFFKDGVIVKWLKRLKTIDKAGLSETCPYCSKWHPGSMACSIRIDAPAHETWMRCSYCGQFWIETERYAAKVTAEEAVARWGEAILDEWT